MKYYPFDDEASWILFDLDELRGNSNMEKTDLNIEPTQSINVLRNNYGMISRYCGEIAHQLFDHSEELKREALSLVEKSLKDTNMIIQNYLLKDNSTFHITYILYNMMYNEFLFLQQSLLEEEFANRNYHFDSLCLNLVILFKYYPLTQESGWFEW